MGLDVAMSAHARFLMGKVTMVRWASQEKP
jgi:hypothetical protein